MSGFAVVVHLDGSPASLDELEPMVRQASHRGPHGSSLHVQGAIGFAHLALWTQPDAKHQPQPLVVDDGRLVLVADARVDNRDELLHALGNGPTTDAPGDAALILAAWRRWGDDCVCHILGDFAFVIWDAVTQTVFAARDALGVSPLHHARYGNVLCLASEAQQIFHHPACPHTLDEETVARWLVGDVRRDRTPFTGVFGLAAAHVLKASAGRITTSRYWDIDPGARIRYKRVQDYADHLLELLTSSVAARLRDAGRVVGAEMSGGMDSTTVTALAHRILAGSGRELVVFSARYPEGACDESRFVEEMRAHLAVDIRRIDAEPFSYPSDFVPSLESPGVTVYPIQARAGEQLAAMGGSVLLTGNGGDELTWGNGLIYLHRLWRGNPRAVSEVIRYCRAEGLPVWPFVRAIFIAPYVPKSIKDGLRSLREGRHPDDWPDWFPRQTAARLRLSRSRPSAPPRGLNLPQRQMYRLVVHNMLRTLVDGYAHTLGPAGVEARHPFLDRRLAEFVFAVPVDLWLRDRWPKWLLRHATRGLLPDAVRWRPDKTAFTSYFAAQIRRNQDWIADVLADPGLERLGLIDTAVAVSRFRASLRDRPEKGGVDLQWALATQSWFRRHRDEFGHVGGKSHA
jgi:asparagine synthase (glutamine-hydrolysing)